jgi:carrier protein
MPTQHSTQKNSKAIGNRIVTTSILNFMFYPIQVVRTLIQVGHEPLEPRVFKTFLWNTQYIAYPGFVPYVKHIYRTHGLLGLYSGSQHFVGSQISFLIASEILKEPTERLVSKYSAKIGLTLEPDVPDNEDGVTDVRHLVKKGIVNFVVSSIVDTTATIISHPLRVVALRSISQLVGGETIYCGFFTPYLEVLSEEGVGGFFSGLIPLILARILNNFIRETLGLLLNVVMSQAVGIDQYGKPVIPHVSSYCATLAMYPLIYTSNLMAIRPARLMAASSPLIPQSSSWIATLSEMRSRGQTFHGTTVISFSRSVRKWNK